MAYFAKFTERGQRALLAAQKEAALLGRTYVGTEHLLLGVLTDPGAASSVLKEVSLDAAREEILAILGRGKEWKTSLTSFGIRISPNGWNPLPI